MMPASGGVPASAGTRRAPGKVASNCACGIAGINAVISIVALAGAFTSVSSGVVSLSAGFADCANNFAKSPLPGALSRAALADEADKEEAALPMAAKFEIESIM